MKLKMALDEKQLDVRLRDRLVAEGKLTKEALDKALNALPDDAKNAVEMGNEENNKNVQ
jgi:exopolyphosphatase/pppGpp-phosphohydrolase